MAALLEGTSAMTSPTVDFAARLIGVINRSSTPIFSATTPKANAAITS